MHESQRIKLRNNDSKITRPSSFQKYQRRGFGFNSPRGPLRKILDDDEVDEMTIKRLKCKLGI